MDELPMKTGDLLPMLEYELTPTTNLTGTTVIFSMKDSDGVVVIDEQPAVIVDATGGIVRYEWVPGDTDVAGEFFGEFQVTYSDGKPETFPGFEYIRILFTAGI